jgi:hypothetical protein
MTKAAERYPGRVRGITVAGQACIALLLVRADGR